MKLSIVLLDWSVRESFHILDYLNDQTMPRADYELIWVEYFGRRVEALTNYCHHGCLDKYLILAHQGSSGDFHKHLAWNAGVVAANGEIIVLCDSDVIVRRSFLQNINDFFSFNFQSFLLIDEIRSANRCFWPFNHPAWEEVLNAPGLENWDEQNQLTYGLLPQYRELPLWRKLFLRNYGACLCLRRSDYLHFGGLDEHESYRGYICGPYDLVVRMANAGRAEHWLEHEFLLHTWHPTGKPEANHIGPHFWHNSATSFKHLFDGRIRPYDENKQIRAIRTSIYPESSREGLLKFSVIAARSSPRHNQRLLDSVEAATRFPFQVIFFGNPPAAAAENGTTDCSLYTAILENLEQADGEIIIIIPANTVFRPGALDQLLDYRGDLPCPVSRLNAIASFTQGLIWQRCGNHFSYGLEVGRMVAARQDRLKDIHTEQDVRQLFCEARTADSVLDAPVQLEIWEDKQLVPSEQLHLLLTDMLDINYAATIQTKSLPPAADAVLARIVDTEKLNPGSFLKYCQVYRSSIREFYDFAAMFSRHKRTDLAATGFELLINASSILTQDINEGIKELAWSYAFLYNDIIFYLGYAHFNLGALAWQKGVTSIAELHLESCLNLTPGHRDAYELLAQIRGKS